MTSKNKADRDDAMSAERYGLGIIAGSAMMMCTAPSRQEIIDHVITALAEVAGALIYSVSIDHADAYKGAEALRQAVVAHIDRHAGAEASDRQAQH